MRRERIRDGVLAMAGFAVIEAAVGALWPAAGPQVVTWEAALSVVGWSAFGGIVAALPQGHRLLPLAWALILGPHLARTADAPALAVVALALGLVGVLRPRVGAALIVGSGLAAAAVGQRPETAPPIEGGAGRDVVLITVDTLRADALGALPGEGWWVFDQAISAAPWTLPAMDSLMRGLPVRRHGGGRVVEGGFTRPDARTTPLAEALQARGYATAAFVSNPHLRAELGFDEGFQRFAHSDRWVEPLFGVHTAQAWRHRLGGPLPRLRHDRDALLVDAAIRWWSAGSSAPRFLWVHLLLPHEYRRDPHPRRAPSDSPADLRAAYRGNVDACAAELTRLLAALGDGPLVFVTADHGESLGEEGRWGHGGALVDPQLRVPLRVRGLGEGRTARQVAVVDLYRAAVEGSLQPLVQGRPVVEVGATRRSPSAWGARIEGGALIPRSAPGESSGEILAPDDALKQALEAIGYVDERDRIGRGKGP
ncbi:MAG: sulfatase-like hydrolase/transferase [Alphaproteobacteria bacterium]|nr:sulfatase-like hydrolase/transferase [Alphaproteobacteria bacterium]